MKKNNKQSIEINKKSVKQKNKNGINKMIVNFKR